jgi:threonine dehydrogenase-like Zn-dependent dehydrogenase
VPDPKIEHPRDAIITVTACAICGSDLHIKRAGLYGCRESSAL